ncbi:hypothetical protein Tco_1517567 [Tanacetum coccineum]
MRTVRNNQLLNLIVYEKFMLKKLGVTEWLESHALASNSQTKSNDLHLKNLKAKLQWDKKAGLKRKRRAELIHEVFVKEDIMVDRMHENLVPPLRREEEFHLENTPQLTRIQNDIKRTHQRPRKCTTNSTFEQEGLAQCKASASNLRRIQVKDIVKEVEDYLKTYSSVGMDMS